MVGEAGKTTKFSESVQPDFEYVAVQQPGEEVGVKVNVGKLVPEATVTELGFLIVHVPPEFPLINEWVTGWFIQVFVVVTIEVTPSCISLEYWLPQSPTKCMRIRLPIFNASTIKE